MQTKALQELKVLEFANLISGPYCGKLLADMGAEVIKIEKPGWGDDSRYYGPFHNDMPEPEKSGLYLWLNTNKKGITLDPTIATGKRFSTSSFWIAMYSFMTVVLKK